MSAEWWVVIVGLAVGGAFGLGLWVGSSLWWTLWRKWGESIDAHEQTIAERDTLTEMVRVMSSHHVPDERTGAERYLDKLLEDHEYRQQYNAVAERPDKS